MNWFGRTPVVGESRITRWGDWTLLAPALALTLLGILTMSTFGQGVSLAPRQIMWLGVGALVYLVVSSIDLTFIRTTPAVMALYVAALLLLSALLVFAHPVMGARAWFSIGPVSFQPADFGKFVLIVFLAKYLSRRYVEIGDIRHILVSGVYTLVMILLVVVEPDMGNALIFSMVWLGMMFVSGISKKHLLALGCLVVVVASLLWFQGLQPYQRARIVSFVNPASDIHGTGYNAYQAQIAVGSGEWVGKGVGYGTQSKLRYLPEYQTDFIFAAFAEEWGFVGVVLLLLLYTLLFARLIEIARAAATNFDAFFTLGVLMLLASHLMIHAGISLGLLPVTGTTIPFMSSGGSHLLLEFGALGVVTSLARYGRGSRHLGAPEYEGG